MLFASFRFEEMEIPLWMPSFPYRTVVVVVEGEQKPMMMLWMKDEGEEEEEELKSQVKKC